MPLPPRALTTASCPPTTRIRFARFPGAPLCRAGAALLFAMITLPLRAADNRPAPEATEIWSPVPPIVRTTAPGIPSDAIVLFDGQNLSAWESAKNPGQPPEWRVDEGRLVSVPKTGNIRTKAAFGDIQLHLEYQIPAAVSGDGQGRGNSGVLFMGRYELQILDSYDHTTYVNGQAASIYKQHAPLANASRRPGEWQSYDAIWLAPRFKPDGTLASPARLTVFHNGVLVHHDVALAGPTAFRGTPPYRAHPAQLPLELQEHNNALAFRNIWVRELRLPAQP